MTTPSERAGLKEALASFEDMINLPPASIGDEPMAVRDYRHALYRAWEPVARALRAERDALAERVEERDFILAILAACAERYAWELRRDLWSASEMSRHHFGSLQIAEARAREAEAKVQALTEERDEAREQLAAHDRAVAIERRRWREHPMMQRLAAVRSHIAGLRPGDAESLATAQSEFMAAQSRIQALTEGLEDLTSGAFVEGFVEGYCHGRSPNDGTIWPEIAQELDIEPQEGWCDSRAREAMYALLQSTAQGQEQSHG